MIDVAVSLNGIRVSGHADIAPRGFDIVCAAVSALTLTLIRGLREIALVEIVDEVRRKRYKTYRNEKKCMS